MQNGLILLVEDDDDNRALMALILKRQGLNVKSVATLTEARLAVASCHYRLYIIDWVLPEGSGLELCREIRRSEPDTPIILSSVRAREVDKAEGLLAGASAYLVKPEDTYHLAETARQLLAA